jgi:SAM-dependent methyltransferase
MELMLDEQHRRGKAAKIIAVLRHFLGVEDLGGRTVVDVGCSAGYIADELAGAGARRVFGFDIDRPGLTKAHQRFGERVSFLLAAGDRLPLPAASVDVVVFNHIYEHVEDPDAVMDEIRRVLRPDGVVYLGFGNRLGIIEPHYRLPFLSYLPARVADRYVRAFGRADNYYERFRTRPGLRDLAHGLFVWDYTVPVIKRPDLFAGADVVPKAAAVLPAPVVRTLMPLVPAYVWVGSPSDRAPAGAALEIPPRRVRTR